MGQAGGGQGGGQGRKWGELGEHAGQAQKGGRGWDKMKNQVSKVRAQCKQRPGAGMHWKGGLQLVRCGPATQLQPRKGGGGYPPGRNFASADTPPGEGAIRMGQRYHCHNKCYTLGSCGGCDVLWQASPVSRPADLVQWSSGSALTLCIMSRTVHHSPCASDAVAQCGTCSTATACR